MQSILEKPRFTVVKPHNSITAADAYVFERQLTLLLKQNPQFALLVDLEQVEFVDSAGLMALISTCKLAQKLEVRFSLCSISPSLRIIIELTQLDNIFEIFESQTQYTEML
ncbi:STAS domain-containing protein [Plectonema cf. radiosum LEGE 06105]|uniref:Anti-sigma factor antagonist n=1 Tax=Plectonema cf. radiosum LEGE 06105 TaxID=945769 RepID=A0A8J7F9Z0_9CYAN|nr:STAS domain-containing protein [Plectonema radiosum]MBE9212348.1 STAS domain-containing protein [Plectonema cf. radiosum LEGE 06105]